jgi:hypothetical protein
MLSIPYIEYGCSPWIVGDWYLFVKMSILDKLVEKLILTYMNEWAVVGECWVH